VKIEIGVIRNGLMVKIEYGPNASDPLAQRQLSGEWFARDTTDAVGRIVEAVKREYDPIVDQLAQD
jgi:hypothetical protein